MRETHRCTGDETECETPAICESCGRRAKPENPVLVTLDSEESEFVCEACRGIHDPINQETNPETGAKVYPAWDREGRPVTSFGTIEGCRCEVCVERMASWLVRARKEFVWGGPTD